MKTLIKKNRYLIIILLLLAIQQIFFILKFPPVHETDTPSYAGPALSLINGGTIYSEIRTPGYPLFLSFFYGLFKTRAETLIVILQHFLGLVLWFLALSFLKNKKEKIIFSALYFCDILFNSYEHTILPDFLFSFFLLLTAYFVKRAADAEPERLSYLAAAGTCVALAELLKPTLYLFPPFAIPFFYFFEKKWIKRIKSYAAFAIIPILAVNICCFYNYGQTRHYDFVPFSSWHWGFSFINFIEIPENSPIRPFFEEGLPGHRMDNQERQRVNGLIRDKIRAGGMSIYEINREYEKAFFLSVLRHPVLFGEKTLRELFHFYFNAHNQYAKNYVKGLPFSVSSALSSGDYRGLLRKMLYSMHPYYWLIFLLTLYYIFINARPVIKNKNMPVIFIFFIIVYLTSVTVLVCEGDARYRMPLQPFMLCMAASVLSGIPEKTGRGKNKII